MGSAGGDWVRMGAFSVGVCINVGDCGSDGEEARAWAEELRAADKRLRPAEGILAKLMSVYLRGGHSYTFLRDRLAPIFPEAPESGSAVGLPLEHGRLRTWLQAQGAPTGFGIHDSLGLAARAALTPWEKDKIAASFHLSQRGPGGYLHGWDPRTASLGDPAMRLFEHQLSGRALGRVDIGDLLPSILEGGELPTRIGKAFAQWSRPDQAWDVATAVWMLAQDEDLAPWKAFCVEKARLKFPGEDSYFPEWVTGSRWVPGVGHVVWPEDP